MRWDLFRAWRELVMMLEESRGLWPRWIFANAIGELVGLGATFGAIWLLTARLSEPQTAGGVAVSFVIAVVSGTIEATVVGLAQWWAMRPWFPGIRRVAWWRATLIGALLGYALGYMPSTLMSLRETAGQAPAAEPPQWVVLLLAAGLGAVAGAVLSFAQWLVLRAEIRHSGLWIPANMLAWAIGMPVVFWSMDLAFKMTAKWESVLVVGVGLFVTGAVVGAVHGRFLVVLYERVRRRVEQAHRADDAR
jgi:hypothetical protein